MKQFTIFILLFFLLNACNNQEKTIKYGIEDAEILHRLEKKLTDIIITDIFNPPVASRVYVYPILASFEAAKFSKKDSKSIAERLNGFEKMPIPQANQEYDFTVSAVQAFSETAKKVAFSIDEIETTKVQILNELKTRSDEAIYNRSLEFGNEISKVILKRWATDNYKETRGMEDFEVKAEKGRWVPTLPDYAKGVEPHWGKMKPMVMQAADQCKPTSAEAYNEDKTSQFWKEVEEVYAVVNKINDEQDHIIRFWDDNPFVSRSKGHLMFQDKKMTPGGHWLAICRIISRHQKADFVKTAQAYSMTSVALYDAFISCWEEKYRSARVRPETVILYKIQKDWKPYLVTPPFPAYTSGHSTISAAAAEVLTGIYGDNVAFTDTTEKEFGLPVRSFTSFRQAALEASESRILAGIHYRSDCKFGNEQGIKVGKLVLEKIK
jgi:hypothetical protein